MAASDEWDDHLVRGFRFDCRPGCALCCYAQPRVSSEELHRLRTAQEIPVAGGGTGLIRVAGYPDGGACRLLSGDRCSVHLFRPLVCSSFPVEPYAGIGGWQPSMVLSCPGLSLAALDEWGRGLVPSVSPSGLDSELRSAHLRAARDPAAAIFRTAEDNRRRGEAKLRRRGLWVDPADLRNEVASHLPTVRDADLPGEEPPDPEDGRDLLPLFYDGRPGPVAIGAHPLGWTLDELSPRGGVARALGALPDPTQVPELEDAAELRLAGYLVYWLYRDQLIDSVLELAANDDAGVTLVEWANSELTLIAATVLARAVLRAHLRGEYGRTLGREAIDRGIAATDADLLDRGGPGSIP